MDVKSDFPIFKKGSLVYLDSAATSQKPQSVIDALFDFYSNHYGTIHRGVYKLSIEATDLYDSARENIANFINAKKGEIVFTRGTTDSINLVASSLARDYIVEGDEIIISEMEHHSNIVPWQMVADKKAKLKVVPMDMKGDLQLDVFEEMLSDRTKIVAISHIANSTGTLNDVKKIIRLSHERGAYVLIDGAQSISHMPIDVKDMGADFYCFSGHKIYGPTGIGILYGKREVLDRMPPVQGGGDMIKEVSPFSSTYLGPPNRFEAGTTPFAQAIGLSHAIDYVKSLGMGRIFEYEKRLFEYALLKLSKIEGVRFIGEASKRASIISFVVEGLEAFDIGKLLAIRDIAIRVGHHCAQLVMKKFKISGTLRVSLAVYNNFEDIDRFIKALEEVLKMLRGVSIFGSEL